MTEDLVRVKAFTIQDPYVYVPREDECGSGTYGARVVRRVI